MYKVYILKTDSKERYYIGHSEDVEKRLSEHNSAKTKSTKAYVPWKIIYTEEYQTKSEVYKREIEIKSYKSGIKFKNLISTERWQSG